MYIKNSRNTSKYKAFSSYQTLCLTERFVVFNPALRIAEPLYVIKKKRTPIKPFLIQTV